MNSLTLRLLLTGVLLLQAGCMSHSKTATYEVDEHRKPAVSVENWMVSVRLAPTVKMTPSDMKTLPKRLSILMYSSYEAIGPYSLQLFVSSPGRIENGVPVAVTSAELRFASGETRTILSRQEPPRTGITEQRPADPRGIPAADYSHCEFRFPLGEKLIFKADERVRAIATVQIAGLPQEVNVDMEFKATLVDEWFWIAEL